MKSIRLIFLICCLAFSCTVHRCADKKNLRNHILIKGSADLQCPTNRVSIEYKGNGNFKVSGCKRTIDYDCRMDSGFPGENDFYCITDREDK